MAEDLEPLPPKVDISQSYHALIAWQGSVTKTLQRMDKTIKGNNRIGKAHEKHLEELNGSLKALQTVKDIAPRLEEIVEKLNPETVDKIVALAESKTEDEAFWRGVKKRLNPLKPVGAGIWLIFLASISGFVVKVFFQ